MSVTSKINMIPIYSIRCNSLKECALTLQFLGLIGVHWRSGSKASDLEHYYGTTTYYHVENGSLSYSRTAEGRRRVVAMAELFKLAGFDIKIIIMLRKIMSKNLLMLYNKV